MIKISELQEYHRAFRSHQELTRAGAIQKGIRAIDEILEFIKFVEETQKSESRVSIVPMEKREGMRRLKELKERQKEHSDSLVDPESDFANIE